MRALLDYGGVEVNDNSFDPQKDTLLHAAVDHLEMIEFLLERGADLEATNENGETPLFGAALDCAGTATLGLLLSRGANVNHRQPSSNLETIVMMLAQNKCHDVERWWERAEYLAAHGADLNLISGNGYSAFEMACVSIASQAKVQVVFLNVGDLKAALEVLLRLWPREMLDTHCAMLGGTPREYFIRQISPLLAMALMEMGILGWLK
jgi:ankyrin repeat protein